MRMNEKQRQGIKALLEHAKSVKVISDEELNKTRVRYLNLCPFCKNLNQYDLGYRELMALTEIACQRCKKINAVNPVPSLISLSQNEINRLEQEVKRRK